LGHHKASARLKGQAGRNGLGAHPSGQMTLRVAQRVSQRHDVRQPGLMGRAMPEVLRDRPRKIVPMSQQQRVNRPEPLQSGGKIRITLTLGRLA
jgi:hypothetical protein